MGREKKERELRKRFENNIGDKIFIFRAINKNIDKINDE